MLGEPIGKPIKQSAKLIGQPFKSTGRTGTSHHTGVGALQKASTQRCAVASGQVLLGEEAYRLVAANAIKKGDVLTIAQLAGIMGAKHTSLLARAPYALCGYLNRSLMASTRLYYTLSLLHAPGP